MPKAETGTSKAAAAPLAEVRMRNVYLGMRLKTLREEVTTLRADKVESAKALRAETDRKSVAAKDAKRRRYYATERVKEAAAEIASLTQQRAAIREKLKA
jgi:hypothetical protein